MSFRLGFRACEVRVELIFWNPFFFRKRAFAGRAD
jgi:hypothetical protein